MAKMEEIRVPISDAIRESKLHWQAFIDELYRLNRDILPPIELVRSITVDMEAGSVPTATITIYGLKMPCSDYSDPLKVVGENGAPD